MRSLTPPSKWQLILVLTVGIVTVSTSAPLARLAMAAAGERSVGFSLVLAASRLALAAIVLIPAWKGFRQQKPSTQAIRYAITAGVALAIHFATWISSLAYTSIAASTALVTTNPVWVALLSWLWLKETLRQQTLVGIAIALAGGLIISLSDQPNPGVATTAWLGNGLALVGAWAASFYFVCGRQAQQQGLGIRPYVAIAYTVAALLLLPVPLLTRTSYTGYSPSVYGCIGLMAVLPQLIGHTSFNWSIRWVSPTLVTLIILLEPVLASLLGFALFQEVPTIQVFGGAIVLLAGVAIAASTQSRSC